MAACKSLKSLNKREFQEFIDSFDLVLSDCDGVLWRETEVIEGSPETAKKFKQIGKKFVFVTNNNCKTRTELIDKCKSHGYEADIETMLCSSYLAAIYLKQINFKKKVFIVGSEGIGKELNIQGIKYTGVGPDVMNVEDDELDTLIKFKTDPEVGAVVVGFDKHFSYPKLVKAATYAHNPKVHFIGTNPDVERPSPNNSKYPGAGCFLRAVETISGRKAIVLGKPEPFVSEVIEKKYGINPARTLMIGDNLNTDILLGKRCGFTTLLVMSGLTTQEDLAYLQQNPKSSIVPNFYTNKLSDVLDCLQSLPYSS